MGYARSSERLAGDCRVIAAVRGVLHTSSL